MFPNEKGKNDRLNYLILFSKDRQKLSLAEHGVLLIVICSIIQIGGDICLTSEIESDLLSPLKWKRRNEIVFGLVRSHIRSD